MTVSVRPGPISADLEGTVAVVIGGSVGIGQVIALTLAGAGATVVAASRSLERLEETRDKAAGTGLTIETVDVRDPDSTERLAAVVEERCGPATVLVNSAGVMVTRAALEIEPEEWDLIQETQLRGTFFACQAFARRMSTVGYGKVINMSSTWAVTAAHGRSAYSSAKAGVGHLTSALAIEWAPLGIRVNAIAPTSTLTPAVKARIEQDPERGEYLVSRIPMGRMATPEDIAGTALFLSSSSSDFITGETIFVDGGWRSFK